MHISRRKKEAEDVVGVPRELSNRGASFSGAIGAARGDSRPADVGGYQVKSHLATIAPRSGEHLVRCVTTDPQRLRRCAGQGRADAWQAFGQRPPVTTHPFERNHASFRSLLLL